MICNLSRHARNCWFDHIRYLSSAMMTSIFVRGCYALMCFLAIRLVLRQPAWPATAPPQYLLFHIFIGAVDPAGVFTQSVPENVLLAVAQNIAATVQPPSPAPNRILGFDIGPISMDQGAVGATTAIKEAFDVALAANMAVAIHLDDRMFWNNATFANGSSLFATPGTTEWTDWRGDPASPLYLSWIPNTNLAPQMCYESPPVQTWTNYWLLNVVGPAIETGYQRLVSAGKTQLFAGVFAGWESNLAYGYCSLSQLGYSAASPPANFQNAQADVLQRHIALWAQDLNQTGIPTNLIYTHVAWPSVQPSVAFNQYSQSGWSNYVWPNDFQQIYGAVGSAPWVQAEGSNVTLGNCTDSACPSPYDWETYLAASYNHGASLVTIFGAFQGETGAFASATGSQAIA